MELGQEISYNSHEARVINRESQKTIKHPKTYETYQSTAIVDCRPATALLSKEDARVVGARLTFGFWSHYDRHHHAFDLRLNGYDKQDAKITATKDATTRRSSFASGNPKTCAPISITQGYKTFEKPHAPG
ncbi:hypothetical protein IAD21_03083 [Abditibacteriota bacterium]|nr:hypothetical protein IAD21_03083 [Abditibacteriota bacterium]